MRSSAAFRYVQDDSVAIIVVEGSGHVVATANATFCQLIDLPASGVIGRPLVDVLREVPDEGTTDVPRQVRGLSDELIVVLDRMHREHLTFSDVDTTVIRGGAENVARQHDSRNAGTVIRSDGPSNHSNVDATDRRDARDQCDWRCTAWTLFGSKGYLDQRVVEFRHAQEESAMLIRQRDIAERLLVSALREQTLSDENAQLYRSTNLARVAAEQAQAHAEQSQALAENAQKETEAASSVKAQFLATMSHELRTPLNAIGGHTQLIDMGIYGPITEAQREALGRIERAQRHLLRLVNDILNLARLESEGVAYTVEPLRLAEVVAELDPLITPQLREKELAYTVNVPPERVVLADREKLVQVLLNLVSNAVKFTPNGGTVTVECADRADGTGDPAFVFLRVRDTGVGIPRDKLDQIFEPFVQVDTSTAGRAAGAGLGLAISRDLARGMGGDLRARSTPGVGSTLTLQLPAAL